MNFNVRINPRKAAMNRWYATGQPLTINTDFDGHGFVPGPLCFDGNYIWVGAIGRDVVHKIDPSNGEILATVGLAKLGIGVADLTFDGISIWAIVGSTLVKVDAISATVTQSFTLEDPGSCITTDGRHVWVGGASRDVAWKIDCASGTLLDTIGLAKLGVGVRDICFDGDKIWATVNDFVSHFDASHNHQATVKAVHLGEQVGGLAFDGRSIRVASLDRDVVFKINASAARRLGLVGVGKTGQGVAALCFDGTWLWAVVNDFVTPVDMGYGKVGVSSSLDGRTADIVSDGAFLWMSHPEQSLLVRR